MSLALVGRWVLYHQRFPGGSDGEETGYSVEDPGSTPGSGRSAREGNGNPPQYSCLENSMDRGDSPWSLKESDTTEQLTLTHTHTHTHTHTQKITGFPGGTVVKNPLTNTGYTGWIPGLRRSPREGNGNPPQYSCFGNPMDRGAWRGYSPWGCKESDTTEAT